MSTWVRVTFGGIVAATLALVACQGDPVAEPPQSVDAFGVSYLRPGAPNSMTWVSNWDEERTIQGRGSVDDEDPWISLRGSRALYQARDGELAITGDVHRMYVHDPKFVRQWRDVEITMYFKRVRDEGVPFAGMVAVARSNHGLTGDVSEDLCDSRGMGARLRYDGLADFEKETAHPENEATDPIVVWEDGMPYNEWIGYKFIVNDLKNGHVRHQLLIDETDGEDGGDWRLIDEFVDTGSNLGDVPCDEGINPMMPLNNNPDRMGSESGLPNLAVYFRSDGVGDNGLIYKWGSIREIA